MKYLFIGFFLLLESNSFSQNDYDSLMDNSLKDIYRAELGSISQVEFYISAQVDYIPSDFSEFKALLGCDNVSAMNTQNGTLNLEFAGTFRKSLLGVSFGFASGGDYDNDTLNIEFNETQYGFSLGYELYNSRRFQVIPKVGFKWHRYRLMNSDISYVIPIDNYLSERDIDIRINQIYGYTGLNLAYKMYNAKWTLFDYWTMGIYGNYILKLNDKPWIYSRNNRLVNNNKIIINNYNVGFYCTFNFGI